MLSFIFGVAVCFVFTLYLYLTYADPQTNIYVTIIVFVTWFLNFFNIVILPYDLFIVIIKFKIRAINHKLTKANMKEIIITLRHSGSSYIGLSSLLVGSLSLLCKTTRRLGTLLVRTN